MLLLLFESVVSNVKLRRLGDKSVDHETAILPSALTLSFKQWEIGKPDK